MSSQAQIDANRKNSKKSTGPKSPEGKAACSQNALKSGIYAFSHVIRGEDPAELEALKAGFLQHHQPSDPTQLALVDTLIATEWTQRRLRRIEAELWACQLEDLDQNLTRAEWIDPGFQHPSPLGRCYQNALEAFSRVQRRIESTNRMFLRTLKALHDLQKSSADQTGQPEARAPELELGEKTQPPSSPIGSVSPIPSGPGECDRRSHETYGSVEKRTPGPRQTHAPTAIRLMKTAQNCRQCTWDTTLPP
jgi:hypothetical protein